MFSSLQHFIQDKCFLALGNLISCHGSTVLRHLETLKVFFLGGAMRGPEDTLVLRIHSSITFEVASKSPGLAPVGSLEVVSFSSVLR